MHPACLLHRVSTCGAQEGKERFVVTRLLGTQFLVCIGRALHFAVATASLSAPGLLTRQPDA